MTSLLFYLSPVFRNLNFCMSVISKPVYNSRSEPLFIIRLMFGRIGFFVMGAVAGMGISECYGPFFKSAVKRDLKKVQRGAESAFDEAKEKYQDVKSVAKEKY